MAKRNFLLGKGERLTEQVRVPTGGAKKISPYTFFEAKARIQPMLKNVVSQIEKMPAYACPDDLAVASIILNPEYIAKSYHPSELLRAIGLETIGSRSRRIKPDKRSGGRQPEETLTTELFVQGKRPSFKRWADDLANWNEFSQGSQQLTEIETVSFPEPIQKLKSVETFSGNSVYEVVLHLNEDSAESNFLNKFQTYLGRLNINSDLNRRFYAGGLCFLELEAPNNLAEAIAEFSLVRLVRKMPSLRRLRPAVRSTGKHNDRKISLPDEEPIDPTIKAAIFDGGIPADNPICRWATPYEFPGMLPPDGELIEHGVSVTSAFLFGHIDPKSPLPRPYSFVDHYRVLDNSPGQNPYELYEVLNRIDNILSTKEYDFVNLSLGPQLPIDDDDVHAWTAVLDEHLSSGKTLTTIAVGNDGEGDPTIGANRVQVPADCVNALGIGACDLPDENWQRASYSSVGPGRSPGLIKPDLVDFGGSIGRPFLTLDSIDGNKLFPTGGTSFSSPSALRMGTGVRAHFGKSLNSLAIRTLLIHCSEVSTISKLEVGWGRISRTLEDMAVCEDHVMRVVFQGKITASKYIRAPIPLPRSPMKGMVKIKATLCYATSVDPHHPGNYTRSGIELVFRPDKDIRKDESSMHATSKSFFGKTQKAFQTEDDLRRDAWKWENCLHAENRFRASSLNEPVFDIHYNARFEGRNDTRNQELQYALVITVDAPNVSDLYNQVVRRYATQLEQLQPIIEIPIRVK